MAAIARRVDRLLLALTAALVGMDLHERRAHLQSAAGSTAVVKGERPGPSGHRALACEVLRLPPSPDRLRARGSHRRVATSLRLTPRVGQHTPVFSTQPAWVAEFTPRPTIP